MEREVSMKKGLRAFLLIFILLIEGSCKKSPIGPPYPDQPIEKTDRTQYYFSTNGYTDEIRIDLYNGTDSTIFMWLPEATLDLKRTDGTWSAWQIRDDLPLGPVLPHKSATMSTWMPNGDSTFPVGTYSFNGEVFFTDSQTCATKGCVSVSVR